MADEAEPKRCRICLEESGEMIAACQCTGSVQWTHEECLRQWIQQRAERQGRPREEYINEIATCEICKTPYNCQLTSRVGEGWFGTTIRQVPMQLFTVFAIVVLVTGTVGGVHSLQLKRGNLTWLDFVPFVMLSGVTVTLVIGSILRFREMQKVTYFDFSSSPRHQSSTDEAPTDDTLADDAQIDVTPEDDAPEDDTQEENVPEDNAPAEELAEQAFVFLDAPSETLDTPLLETESETP